MTLVCTPTIITVGQPTTCTTTVTDTSPNPSTPTGTVTFTPSGKCTLAIASVGSAKCSVNITPTDIAETVSVAAKYGRDLAHDTSTNIVILTVKTSETTTTTVGCTSRIVQVGDSITCNALVSDSMTSSTSTVPTGTVMFSPNGDNCTLTFAGLYSAGCLVTITSNTAATLIVSANYTGDNTHLASHSNTIRVTFNNIVSTTCQDPDSISSHVYNPSQLTIVKQCVTASGTVDRAIPEDDGSLQIGLVLDPVYTNLTNSANVQYQNGELVVIIICNDVPYLPAAVTACQNYTNRILAPNIGDHIIVKGPLVNDTQHNNWAEIHPVYSLTITGSAISATVHVEQQLVISYPTGSSTGWLGSAIQNQTAAVTVGPGYNFTETLSLTNTSNQVQQISSINVTSQGYAPGYSLVSPNSTVIIFQSRVTVTVTIVLQAPDQYYWGVLEIDIFTT